MGNLTATGLNPRQREEARNLNFGTSNGLGSELGRTVADRGTGMRQGKTPTVFHRCLTSFQSGACMPCIRTFIYLRRRLIQHDGRRFCVVIDRVAFSRRSLLFKFLSYLEILNYYRGIRDEAYHIIRKVDEKFAISNCAIFSC